MYSISLLFRFENVSSLQSPLRLTHTAKVISCVNLLSINLRGKQMYARYLILIFFPKRHDTKVCVMCVKNIMLFLFLVCSCLSVWIGCCVLYGVCDFPSSRNAYTYIHLTREPIRSVIHILTLILFGCVYHFFVLSVFLSGANIFLSFPFSWSFNSCTNDSPPLSSPIHYPKNLKSKASVPRHTDPITETSWSSCVEDQPGSPSLALHSSVETRLELRGRGAFSLLQLLSHQQEKRLLPIPESQVQRNFELYFHGVCGFSKTPPAFVCIFRSVIGLRLYPILFLSSIVFTSHPLKTHGETEQTTEM